MTLDDAGVLVIPLIFGGFLLSIAVGAAVGHFTRIEYGFASGLILAGVCGLASAAFMHFGQAQAVDSAAVLVPVLFGTAPMMFGGFFIVQAWASRARTAAGVSADAGDFGTKPRTPEAMAALFAGHSGFVAGVAWVILVDGPVSLVVGRGTAMIAAGMACYAFAFVRDRPPKWEAAYICTALAVLIGLLGFAVATFAARLQ